MLTAKQQLKKVLDELPEDCSIEEVHCRLYVLEEIEKGLDDLEKGRVISHEEMKRQFFSSTSRGTSLAVPLSTRPKSFRRSSTRPVSSAIFQQWGGVFRNATKTTFASL
jgi:hypothetical protein